MVNPAKSAVCSFPCGNDMGQCYVCGTYRHVGRPTTWNACFVALATQVFAGLVLYLSYAAGMAILSLYLDRYLLCNSQRSEMPQSSWRYGSISSQPNLPCLSCRS